MKAPSGIKVQNNESSKVIPGIILPKTGELVSKEWGQVPPLPPWFHRLCKVLCKNLASSPDLSCINNGPPPPPSPIFWSPSTFLQFSPILLSKDSIDMTNSKMMTKNVSHSLFQKIILDREEEGLGPF